MGCNTSSNGLISLKPYAVANRNAEKSMQQHSNKSRIILRARLLQHDLSTAYKNPRPK